MTSRTDNHPAPSIEVRLLGSPAVLSAGEPLAIPSRKATALLAYLAMRPDEPISRDHLAGLLWGESSNEQARANLRQALTQVRRVFRGCGLDPIETRGDTVVLSSDGLSIDAHRLARADSILDPDRLHCDNEFLEGFSVSEPEFERWLTVQRESLRRRVRQLHEAAAEDAFQKRRMDEAIDHLTIALNLDPLQEHVHRRLMTLFAAQGRTDAAVAQFERCRAALGQELGIQPDNETTALYEKIRSRRMTRGGDPATHALPPVEFRMPMENPPAMVLDKPSIAVLAFENMSDDQEQEYFSDGVVEDIITDLSKITGLFVIARNSAFAYKGKRRNVRDVCRELGVRYVLEGSVRRVADQVRITAQLIDGASGGHVWAQRYDRKLHDIFAVQDEVTRDIVSALALKLTPEERERVYRRDTGNLEAYEHFLRGREHAFRDTQEANVQARVMLEKAIELDAQFSLAFSHLSRNHVIAYVNRWGETADQSLELAMELGQHAVELDETNPHAYFAVAAAALWTKQHQRAAVAAEKSLAIDPNFAEGHAVLGLILVYSGKPRAAIASLHKAMRLDPHYRDIYLHLLALAYVQLEEYGQAVAMLKRRLVRKPESDISRVLLAATYGHMGEVEESRAEWTEALRINPQYSLEHRRKILPYENPADFEHLLDGLRKAGLAK
jgi:TolB-like protein/DNA-binding SARP family transcriptional activator